MRRSRIYQSAHIKQKTTKKHELLVTVLVFWHVSFQWRWWVIRSTPADCGPAVAASYPASSVPTSCKLSVLRKVTPGLALYCTLWAGLWWWQKGKIQFGAHASKRPPCSTKGQKCIYIMYAELIKIYSWFYGIWLTKWELLCFLSPSVEVTQLSHHVG